MDKLSELFEIQYKFTKMFFDEKCDKEFLVNLKNDKKNLIKWNKEYILAIIKETTELLDEINWKTHHSKFDDDDSENFLEEAIDAMKYLLGILIINGFTVDDIYNKFKDKSDVVELKFKQNKLIETLRQNKNTQIAIIDIDGVIVKFPENFIDYVNNNTKQNFNSLEEIKNSKLVDYFSLKKSFRASGFEGGEGELITETKELIEKLKANNVYIILLTARPYKKYFRLFSDTLKWLNKNNVYFDIIIWEEEKAEFIVNSLKDNDVLFCVDDDISNVNKLSKCFKTYLVKNVKLYSSEEDMLKKIQSIVDDRVIVVESTKEIKL